MISFESEGLLLVMEYFFRVNESMTVLSMNLSPPCNYTTRLTCLLLLSPSLYHPSCVSLSLTVSVTLDPEACYVRTRVHYPPAIITDTVSSLFHVLRGDVANNED